MSQAQAGGINNQAASEALQAAESGSAVDAAALEATGGDLSLAASGGGITSNTTVSSLSALKKLSPQLYNQIVQSIMSNMMIDMQQHEANVEQAMKALCDPDQYGTFG